MTLAPFCLVNPALVALKAHISFHIGHETDSIPSKILLINSFRIVFKKLVSSDYSPVNLSETRPPHFFVLRVFLQSVASRHFFFIQVFAVCWVSVDWDEMLIDLFKCSGFFGGVVQTANYSVNTEQLKL